MRIFITYICIGIISIFALTYSFFTLKIGNIQSSSISEIYRMESNDSILHKFFLGKSFEYHSQLADRFINQISIKDNVIETNELLCSAFFHYTKALAIRPLSPSIIGITSYIATLTSKKDCAHINITDEQVRERIRNAQSMEPLNGRISMYAARVFDHYDNDEAKEDYIVDFLKSGYSPTKQDRKFIYTALSKSTSPKELLPTSFKLFSYYLINISFEDYPLFLSKRQIFSRHLVALIMSTRETFSVQDLNTLVKIRNLNLPTEASQLIDELIHRILNEEDGSYDGQYFLLRSRYSQINSVTGLIRYNSLPLKGSLTDWNSHKYINIQSKKMSIGYINSSQKEISALEIRANDIATSIKTSLLELYTSDDNYNWKKFNNVLRTRSYKLHGTSYVFIELPSSKALYWKIHYNSSNTIDMRKTLLNESIFGFTK